MTRDAKVMLGDPKKALIAMAIPIVISNFIQSANNIIDTIWLTSIGVDAQAAVSTIFPIFFIVIDIVLQLTYRHCHLFLVRYHRVLDPAFTDSLVDALS